jgi:hypothetical protein
MFVMCAGCSLGSQDAAVYPILCDGWTVSVRGGGVQWPVSLYDWGSGCVCYWGFGAGYCVYISYVSSGALPCTAGEQCHM